MLGDLQESVKSL